MHDLKRSTFFQARDHYGHTPLHKAVMANQESIVKHLVDYFPELIESRDNVRSNDYIWEIRFRVRG